MSAASRSAVPLAPLDHERARLRDGDLTARASTAPDVRPRRTGFLRTDFAVGREYEDGKFVPTHLNMTRDLAEATAGRMRDTSSDAQVAQQLDERWTWGYRSQRGNTSGKNGYGRGPAARRAK